MYLKVLLSNFFHFRSLSLTFKGVAYLLTHSSVCFQVEFNKKNFLFYWFLPGDLLQTMFNPSFLPLKYFLGKKSCLNLHEAKRRASYQLPECSYLYSCNLDEFTIFLLSGMAINIIPHHICWPPIDKMYQRHSGCLPCECGIFGHLLWTLDLL